LSSGKIYFLHDKPKPHVVKIVKEKKAKLGWEMLPHPSYSPDLEPSEYQLFGSGINYLRGVNEEALKNELQIFLTQSPRNSTPKAFTIYQDVGQMS